MFAQKKLLHLKNDFFIIDQQELNSELLYSNRNSAQNPDY